MVASTDSGHLATAIFSSPAVQYLLLGTTSVRVDSLENLSPTVEEVNRNIREGAAMIPSLAARGKIYPCLLAGEAAASTRI